MYKSANKGTEERRGKSWAIICFIQTSSGSMGRLRTKEQINKQANATNKQSNTTHLNTVYSGDMADEVAGGSGPVEVNITSHCLQGGRKMKIMFIFQGGKIMRMISIFDKDV